MHRVEAWSKGAFSKPSLSTSFDELVHLQSATCVLVFGPSFGISVAKVTFFRKRSIERLAVVADGSTGVCLHPERLCLCPNAMAAEHHPLRGT